MPLARYHRLVQWGAMLAASVGFVVLLELVQLPAAMLLGPMLAAIVVAISRGTIKMARLPYDGAQSLIGCLVAGAITPAIVHTFFIEWPLFLSLGLTMAIAGGALGWIVGKLRIFPGATGVWAFSPGGVMAMILMAEAFGGDARLVAFIQYLRVVFVAVSAAIIARLWVGTSGVTTGEIIWFAPIHWLSFAETLAIALFGGILGRVSRLPAGVLLVPLIVGSFLHGTGTITIELPPWLMAISYAIVGWSIGLGFTRQILASAMRVLPQIIMAILAMMMLCGALAFILVGTLNVDPLTAYLATSPGGMDSIAIIAVSSKADIAFVIGLQTVRFLIVLLIGPFISRFVIGLLRVKGARVEAHCSALDDKRSTITKDDKS